MPQLREPPSPRPHPSWGSLHLPLWLSETREEAQPFWPDTAHHDTILSPELPASCWGFAGLHWSGLLLLPNPASSLFSSQMQIPNEHLAPKIPVSKNPTCDSWLPYTGRAGWVGVEGVCVLQVEERRRGQKSQRGVWNSTPVQPWTAPRLPMTEWLKVLR